MTSFRHPGDEQPEFHDSPPPDTPYPAAEDQTASPTDSAAPEAAPDGGDQADGWTASPVAGGPVDDPDQAPGDSVPSRADDADEESDFWEGLEDFEDEEDAEESIEAAAEFVARWYKRILLSFVVLIVLALVFRLGVNYQAQKKLDDMLAHYREAGQPVELSDFLRPPVPDEDNAALLLEQAAQTLPPCPLSKAQLRRFLHSPDAVVEHEEAVAGWVAQATESLAAVEAAHDKSGVAWSTTLSRPLLDMDFPELVEQRRLAGFLAAAGRLAHHRGDDAAALQRASDILLVERTLQRWPAPITIHLLSLAVGARACGPVIEYVVPTLRIAPGEGTTNAGGAASREQLRRLIARLLDERELHESWRQAVYCERVYIMDTVAVCDGRIPAKVSFTTKQRIGAWLARPLMVYSAIDALREADRLALVADCPNYPAARKVCEADGGSAEDPDAAITSLAQPILPTYGRAIRLRYTLLAYRRMAAVALALRWFEVDNGQRPAELSQLVPRYLPRVPEDACAADGRLLGYLPTAEHPRLYSVGPNMTDDGGQWHLDDKGELDAFEADFVFFLNGYDPTTAHEATEDDSTKPR